MMALCCTDDWWNHLFEAELESSKAKSNGEDIDTGRAFLDNLESVNVRFDVNEYFTVLNHLAPVDGYVLDYVYFAPGGDGFPKIYARLEGESGFTNYDEYEAFGIDDYLNHIQVDGTAEGFF
jgi:hypothetical protein